MLLEAVSTSGGDCMNSNSEACATAVGVRRYQKLLLPSVGSNVSASMSMNVEVC